MRPPTDKAPACETETPPPPTAVSQLAVASIVCGLPSPAGLLICGVCKAINAVFHLSARSIAAERLALGAGLFGGRLFGHTWPLLLIGLILGIVAVRRGDRRWGRIGVWMNAVPLGLYFAAVIIFTFYLSHAFRAFRMN